MIRLILEGFIKVKVEFRLELDDSTVHSLTVRSLKPFKDQETDLVIVLLVLDFALFGCSFLGLFGC